MRVRTQCRECGLPFNERLVGRTVDVLVETVNPLAGRAEGRTAYDAPDVDGTVHLAGPREALEAGRVIPVRITGTRDAYDLEAELPDAPASGTSGE